MTYSLRPHPPSPARAGLRSDAVTAPDGRRASARRWPEGDLLNDPSLLDEGFDELACDLSVLLRIVSLP